MKRILLTLAFLSVFSMTLRASEVIDDRDSITTRSLQFAHRFTGIETKVTVKWIHENFVDGNEGMNFVVKPGKVFRIALGHKNGFHSCDKIMELELRHKVEGAIGVSGDIDTDGFGYSHKLVVAGDYINRSMETLYLDPFLLFRGPTEDEGNVNTDEEE